MEYIGMAKLKLYEDISCTQEAKTNTYGSYVLNVKAISGQPTHTFTKTMYVKNVGTHKAYNVKLKGDNKNISLEKEIIEPKEKCKVTITKEIQKGDKNISIYLTDLEYTQLP